MVLSAASGEVPKQWSPVLSSIFTKSSNVLRHVEVMYFSWAYLKFSLTYGCSVGKHTYDRFYLTTVCNSSSGGGVLWFFSSSYMTVRILGMSYGNWAKLDSVVSFLYYLYLLNLKQFQVCKHSSHTPGCIMGIWVLLVKHCQKWTTTLANTAVYFTEGTALPSHLCGAQSQCLDLGQHWQISYVSLDLEAYDCCCSWFAHKVVGRSVVFIFRTRIKDTCYIYIYIYIRMYGQQCLKTTSSR